LVIQSNDNEDIKNFKNDLLNDLIKRKEKYYEKHLNEFDIASKLDPDLKSFLFNILS